MLSFLTQGKKKQHEFDLQANYMKVEFLTEDQKVKKDSALKLLQSQYSDDLQTIIPYQSSFNCSYRLVFNSGAIKAKITLSQLMALLQVSSDAQFQEFYETNVNKIKLHMKDNKLISQTTVLQLYNERDISVYNPPEILEVIYEPKSFFHRVKAKSVKIIKSIPQMAANLVIKIVMGILRFMGFSAGQSILTKLLPIRLILQWILNFLMVFFPALTPVIGIGKMLM